jgi:hypothetical protein
MTTETPRVALYQRLTEVLGPDHASTLMTYLPTDGPASKTDFREFSHRMDRFEDRIDARLNHFDLRFDSLHEAMRQQTRTFILAATANMVTLSAVAFGAATLI